MRSFGALVLAFVAFALDGAPLREVTLAPRNGVLRLAVTGDTGEGAEKVAAGIAHVHARQALDAIVLTGDNFYPCGVTAPDDPRWSLVMPLTRIGVPVFPVLGNHDFCGRADPDAQVGAPIANWVFPGREYVVRGGIADFAFVDTDSFVKRRTSSLPLDEAFASSKARWRVVVGHHPVISSGWHGYFPRDEVRRMRGTIPTLRAVKADLFIAGHDHHVELIRGRMLHLISGAGSSPVPPLKLRLSTVYPPEIRRERIGFAVVELTAEKIRVRLYDAKGRAKSGWL